MALWNKLKKLATEAASSKPEIYLQRLNFEISEIEKQGTISYWENLVTDCCKKIKPKPEKNPNNLVLPYLIGLVKEDPILNTDSEIILTTKFSDIKRYIDKHGKLPKGIIKDADMPDVDIDCLPQARDHIKQYAIERYKVVDDEYGSVCSVGTWSTYKFKSALADVALALGNSMGPECPKSEIYELTTKLPEEVDELKPLGVASCVNRIDDKECGHIYGTVTISDGELQLELKCPKCGGENTDNPTLAQMLKEFDILSQFYYKRSHIVDYAVRMIGRIKSMSMHAGALIITDRPLYGNIPLAKNTKHDYWTSMWPEGKSTQLSKFGYVKWDILGLKTLNYIFHCCKLIQDNKGIYFGDIEAIRSRLPDNEKENAVAMDGWDDIDPRENKAGHYYKNGEKHIIALNDPEVLKIANQSRTDTIFQFDTDLAKSILKNEVRNFNDLMILNAMGHPGPIQCVHPDSNINTKDGYIKISDLNPDTNQIAYFDKNQNIKYTTKYKVYKSKPKQLLKITIGNKQIKVSKQHRILVTRDGTDAYIQAQYLRVGDKVLSIHGFEYLEQCISQTGQSCHNDGSPAQCGVPTTYHEEPK